MRFVVYVKQGCFFGGKIQIRIPNPITDFAFFGVNRKTDHESIKSTLRLDSSDQIQIRIFEIQNLSVFRGKGFEKSIFDKQFFKKKKKKKWYATDAVHV